MAAQILRIKRDSGQWALSRARHKAHARRKYYDLYAIDRSPIAREAIRRIGELYAIERQIRGAVPEVRRCVRRKRSAPVLRGGSE
jgi:hypothetical protein